ncbi:MAG: hypothetical protein OXC29_14230 [Rhodococcus sp.]|nr:hypothetical protein [Rhodococcus sp. (in: high G+C Gram-positive bacteria)]
MTDIIRSAVDEDGERIHIDRATTGHRYHGLGAHDGCLLYPVHRDRKRSSFAHLPNRAHCSPPTGESEEHRQAKEQWAKYLGRYLTPCGGCSSWGVAAPNLHRASCQRPFFADIAWFCDTCLRGHLYELPKEAANVAVEKSWFGGIVRPDVTVIDRFGEPLIFLEFRKSHLSPRIGRIARRHGIPLFVIDVVSGDSQRQRLHNPQHRWYDEVEELDDEQRDEMRLFSSFPGTYFNVLPNRGGKAVPTLHHIPNPEGEPNWPPLPNPHFGHYLLADQTTLGCASQQHWLSDTETGKKQFRE